MAECGLAHSGRYQRWNRCIHCRPSTHTHTPRFIVSTPFSATATRWRISVHVSTWHAIRHHYPSGPHFPVVLSELSISIGRSARRRRRIADYYIPPTITWKRYQASPNVLSLAVSFHQSQILSTFVFQFQFECLHGTRVDITPRYSYFNVITR